MRAVLSVGDLLGDILDGKLLVLENLSLRLLQVIYKVLTGNILKADETLSCICH